VGGVLEPVRTKVQGICYCFACLKPHGLFRFLAGDRHAKDKSITDDR